MILLLSTGSLACYQNVYNSFNANWKSTWKKEEWNLDFKMSFSWIIYTIYSARSNAVFKKSMTASAQEISEVGYEQQIFARKGKTIKPSPNLKQKACIRNIKDQCCGTVKRRPKSIILFLQQGVVKLFSDPRLNSNLQNGVAEHRSPSFLAHHSLGWATACVSLCKNSDFQPPSQHRILFR